jgi:hypothetical protein
MLAALISRVSCESPGLGGAARGESGTERAGPNPSSGLLSVLNSPPRNPCASASLRAWLVCVVLAESHPEFLPSERLVCRSRHAQRRNVGFRRLFGLARRLRSTLGMSRFVRPWYCVPPRRERSFSRRRESACTELVVSAFLTPRLSRTRRRCEPRFSSPGPLRRYERLGRCGGLGPRGTLRVTTAAPERADSERGTP